MRTDRRSFFRLLAGAAALLTGNASVAKSAPERFDIHWATRNTRLGAFGVRWPRLSGPPRDHKRYPKKRQVALPARVDEPARTLAEIVRQWAPAEGFDSAAISLAQLGRLLHFTNGVTLKAPPDGRGPARRAAPSAGALYSGEVYVAAARVQGLPPGIYYYEVREHRLVEVAAGFEPARLAAAIESPALGRGAAATILLSNVFGRYSWRYANRGYRYALIDSGHIGENLRLAAASAGLAQRDFLVFRDDLLNELLAIDGVKEAVCSVHAVGLPGSAPKGAQPAPPWVEAQYAPGFTARGPITDRYHAATKLVPQVEGVAQPGVWVDSAPRSREPNVALPARAAGPPMKLEGAIQIRRSTARFEAGKLSLADFGHILEMAHGHAGLARSGNVELYLVVHRVDSLEPGLYRYDRERHRLVVQRTGNLAREFTRVCLGQEKAGTAAVGVLMVARLGEDRGLATTRRYRDMLVESGAIGQRIYLAAESAGLSARNLAAFIDDDLNPLLGLDGQREAAIHLTMLGPGN
ncbi:MAG: SagB/ThcOx family dehydrogenase [Deltaproteobacteria bacterium]|jgi:SagB-type dehydrogenase family enzyme|nr:SagB/ThcOx family dehydrogenase [Deltaproteobacteria bacterium]